MSYKKPDGLLLAKPVKRIAPKSSFLKKLEAMQQPKRTPEEKAFLNAAYGEAVKHALRLVRK